MDNKKRNKEIIKKYIDNKLSLSTVGNQYNLSRERIRQILNDNNIKPRKYSYSIKYSKQNINKIIDYYYKNNIPLMKILKENDLNGITFYKYIKIHSIDFNIKHIRKFIKYNENDINNAINDKLNNKLSTKEIIEKYKINKPILFYYLRKRKG